MPDRALGDAAEQQATHATVAVGATEYAIQTLYHNLLLFVLPAYYASATLDSANAVFLAGVGAGALVTAVDPWYRRVIRPRPWVSHALFGTQPMPSSDRRSSRSN